MRTTRAKYRFADIPQLTTALPATTTRRPATDTANGTLDQPKRTSSPATTRISSVKTVIAPVSALSQPLVFSLVSPRSAISSGSVRSTKTALNAIAPK